MLGFKKRKAAKLERLENEQREREMEARIKVRRTLGSIKKQISKLDGFKKDYIEKARQALLTDNKQTYNLAKSGLKLCLSKQRFLDTMVANFEISMQINDMNQVIGEFVEGMNIISEQMKGITSSIDMTKAQISYEKALENNASQYEALDMFLATATESLESFDELSSNVSDEEIDQLIANQVVDGESQIDKEIEEKINSMKEKLTVV